MANNGYAKFFSWCVCGGGGGRGGRGVVNKVHHDECENGDKHYIKHYIEAFC